MKILKNEFKDQVAEELRITNISLNNNDNLGIQHRYHSLYVTLKKQLIDYQEQMDTIYGKLYEKYKFKSDLALTTKTDVEIFIKRNTIYQKYNKLIQLKKLEIERVLATVELFKSRGYSLKNAIEILKMEIK